MQTEINNYLTMMLAGFISMIMLYGLSTIIVRKLADIRISGASIVAAFFCSWITLGVFTYPFTEKAAESSWLVALFMLVMVANYVGWLYIFQPASLEILTRKELKVRTLKKLEIAQGHVVNEIKEAKKAGRNSEVERLKGVLDGLNIEVKEVKKVHANIGLIARVWGKFFSKKSVDQSKI